MRLMGGHAVPFHSLAAQMPPWRCSLRPQPIHIVLLEAQLVQPAPHDKQVCPAASAAPRPTTAHRQVGEE